jgi:hypothetical protein
MRELFLDIETIPTQRPGALEELRATVTPPGNITKAESIQKWMDENADAKAEELWRKTSFDGTQGELVVIGFAVEDDAPITLWRGLGASEGDLLQNAFDAMVNAAPAFRNPAIYPCFVGHNVIGFDLRFLFQRAVILGVKPPFTLPVDTRYNGDRVYDTMLGWAGWGNRVKLTTICDALGIPVKTGGIDGSMVWDYVKAGRAEEVAAYWGEDVTAVREVYRRMTFADVVEEGKVAA